MTQIQILNPEQLELLAGEFQRRYETQFSLAQAMGLYMGLAGVRGFWPCSIQVLYSSSDIRLGCAFGDNNHHLTHRQGGVVWGYSDGATPNYGIAPWIEFSSNGVVGATADFYSWKITGSETTIYTPGLTVGAWIRPAITPSPNEAIVTKGSSAVPTYSFGLHRNNPNNTIRFEVWNGGVNYYIDSTEVTNANTWYFVCGRYKPSTSVTVTVNETHRSLTSGIPASINDVTAYLTLGARIAAGGFNLYYTGRMSMVFLCASYLGDEVVQMLYSQTRAMFGA